MKNHGSVNNKVEICTTEAGDAFSEGRILLVASSNCVELTIDETRILYQQLKALCAGLPMIHFKDFIFPGEPKG